MNTQPKDFSILHRPPRRINRVALSAASSRAGKRNYATADPSHLSSNNLPGPTQIPLNRLSSLAPRNRCDISTSTAQATFPPQTLFKPRSSVHIAAFNVRTLKQAGQQVALAQTLDTLKIDVCCLSETRIQDPSIVVDIYTPLSRTQYRLRTSGDPASEAEGIAGVGIVHVLRAAIQGFPMVHLRDFGLIFRRVAVKPALP